MVWDDFKESLSRSSRNILGVMTGTSADGIEFALTRCAGTGKEMKIELLESASIQFDASFRSEVLKLYNPSVAGVDRVNFMNFYIAQKHAEYLSGFLSGVAFKVDAIAYHGQTVYHDPTKGATLQLGEADVISTRTGLPVIFDFRKKDMALGGEGAPLIPYFDWIYFDEGTYAVNLGGIANVTYVAARLEEVLAFDCGPANCLIDLAVKKHFNLDFDEDGVIASKGVVREAILRKLIERDETYFLRRPPKSTGREVYNETFLKNISCVEPEDLVRTLVRFTVRQLVESIKTYLPEGKWIVVTGGGAMNPIILEDLKNLSGLNVTVPEREFIQAKEAMGMAVLAQEFLNGVGANVPSVTGAQRRAVLGKLALP